MDYKRRSQVPEFEPGDLICHDDSNRVWAHCRGRQNWIYAGEVCMFMQLHGAFFEVYTPNGFTRIMSSTLWKWRLA